MRITPLLRGALLAAALVSLARASFAQSPVLVVDDDGGAGVDFSGLQAAVDAAASGTVILVKDGVYGDVNLAAKSLVIAAERGASPRVFGSLSIVGVGAADRVVVRGLDVLVPLGGSPVRVEACAGSVAFEDCELRNGTLGQFGSLAAAAIVESSGRVAFTRCSLEGSTGGWPNGGGAGLVVRAARVHLYDCVAVGGLGAIGQAIPGGDGVLVDDGFLFASGGGFQGAAGGDGVTLTLPTGALCFDGGAGGTGLSLVGPATSAVLLDVALSGAPGGGAGGGTSGACLPGAAGTATSAPPEALTTLAGDARSFTAESPVRELEETALALHGAPGELVLLAAALGSDAEFVGPLAGTVLVELGAAAFAWLGPTDSGGDAGYALFVPPLLPSGAGLAFTLQPLFVDPLGVAGATLGPASGLLVLSSSL